MKSGVDPVLACPTCRSRVRLEAGHAVCASCDRTYPAREGLIDFRLQDDRSLNDRQQEEIWDRNSAGSPSIPVDGLVCRNDFKSHFLRYLSDAVPWPGADSLTIDLGSFDGAMSRNWTYRYGTRVCGVDQSEFAIRRARRVDPFENIYHLASLEHLPFGDATFDAAICLDVLEHVNDVEKVVVELVRVLKPGAPFLLYVVSSRGQWTWDWWVYHLRGLVGLPRAPRFGDNAEGGHDADRLVDPYRLTELLQVSGCTITSLHAFHAFFTALYDDVIRRLVIDYRSSHRLGEPPPTSAPAPEKATRQPVIDMAKLTPGKRRRLRFIERACRLAQFCDLPWRWGCRGRGFAVVGRKGVSASP